MTAEPVLCQGPLVPNHKVTFSWFPDLLLLLWGNSQET